CAGSRVHRRSSMWATDEWVPEKGDGPLSGTPRKGSVPFYLSQRLLIGSATLFCRCPSASGLAPLHLVQHLDQAWLAGVGLAQAVQIARPLGGSMVLRQQRLQLD